MNATITEYKGIVFDSKSEAVFARTLDLGGHRWVYHPPQHCGHIWDFLVFRSHMNNEPILVEYKPQMPTNTYVDNLTEKMRADPKESIVVWGNPWDGIDHSIDGPQECCYRVYPIFCIKTVSGNAKYGWGDFIRLADNGGDWPTSYRHETWDVLGITEEMVQEAKEYRFDLA